MSVRERIQFFGQMRANFEHTGALQPSSRFLARAMAAPMRNRSDTAAARILEIGPGTGAVTRAIAANMGPEDELDCYEINGEFVRILKEALADDAKLQPVAARIRIHHAAAQDLDARTPFDFAICSAPLNNFDAATIDAILGTMLGALAEGGTATMFEYALLPGLRRSLTTGATRRRLDASRAAKDKWLTAHGRASTFVLCNVPPARVHTLAAISSV